MKKLFLTLLLSGAAVFAASAAFANEPARGSQQSQASSYSQMEPAAGDARARTSSTQTDIRSLQMKLSARGYDVGQADGILGPRTQQALREFQRDNSLSVTGKADNATLGQLGLTASAGGTVNPRGTTGSSTPNNSGFDSDTPRTGTTGNGNNMGTDTGTGAYSGTDATDTNTNGAQDQR